MNPKPKTQPTICSNCSNPIGKTGVCMPSGDPKKQMMCVECAKTLVDWFAPPPPGFAYCCTHGIKFDELCDACGRTPDPKADITENPKPCLENWEKIPFTSKHVWRADHHNLPSGECERCGKDYRLWVIELEKRILKTPKPKPRKANMCPHCNGDLRIRNPMGNCDHLYYPENCDICKTMTKTPKPRAEEWEKALDGIIGRFFRVDGKEKHLSVFRQDLIDLFADLLSHREQEVRERLESMKPEKNYHANHEIDNHCFQCMEIVEIHPEYTRGFSDALDQAIEAVRKAGK